MGAGGRLGSGRPGPAALPYIYLLVGTPPSAGGVREEAPRLRGAGRQPGLLCTPRHCPPRACAGRAWGETGLVRRGLRWGPRAHPWLLSKKGHPSPSLSPPSSPTPPPYPRERGLWVADGGMLGRAAGRNSYSPYTAGRRRTGKADSPKRSLDSLPHSPTVWLTVRPGAPHGCRRGGTGVSGAAAPRGGGTEEGFQGLGWPQPFWGRGLRAVPRWSGRPRGRRGAELSGFALAHGNLMLSAGSVPALSVPKSASGPAELAAPSQGC